MLGLFDGYDASRMSRWLVHELNFMNRWSDCVCVHEIDIFKSCMFIVCKNVQKRNFYEFMSIVQKLKHIYMQDVILSHLE